MNAHTHRLVFNLRRNSPIAAPESARSCGRGRQAGRQRRQGGRRRGACANRLALNPATTQKRLGDGFYEQRLITEQIAQLTGRRFLTGYQNDEAQYQALMEAGATFAKTWQLIPGIALTAEQMARLTSDIVWLVEKEVAGQKVLVPQVYARVEDGDLAPSGALLAGAAVNLDTATELINSGRIAGRQVVSLTAENIKNLGGDVAGKEIFADARKDLQLKGGSFTAESRLIATAGRDLTVESSTVDLDYRAAGVNGSVRRTDISRVAGLYVTGDNGTLVASAGNDLALLAAAIVNSNPTAAGPAGGTTATTLLAAGNNLMLGTVTETRDAATSTKKTRWSESATTEVGSSIQTAGDLTLTAGNDLTARAATVQSGGAIDAAAGNDLTIETGQASYASDYTRKSSSSGFLSKKRTTTHNTSESTTTIASTFSGDRVTMTANRDIGVKGSNVVATNDTTLAAGRDIAVEAAIDTYRSSHVREKTKSGTFSTGLDATNKVHEEQRAQGSVISAGRDLSITAGAQTNRDGMPEAIASASSQQGSLIIQGSALDAGRDLAIQTTGDLLLLAAYSQSHETTQRTTQTRRKLETLNFDLDQTRALLATLTAGNSIDLNVGGNVAAQIGSMDSSGNLQADRMTATGVIKGSDRQQVSLTHTSDKKGTTTNGPTSKVLGNLAAQGIRSGAADSFAPEALQSGQAAVTALMQNGLLTITNQPAIQAAL
ncbi:MAG: filamentous hemagglutinin, partial [Pseudomonadota bacterium]|nr:filamentous hemagglutinin [Pseudomonadota bacterium]